MKTTPVVFLAWCCVGCGDASVTAIARTPEQRDGGSQETQGAKGTQDTQGAQDTQSMEGTQGTQGLGLVDSLSVASDGTACAAGTGALFIRGPRSSAWSPVPLSPSDMAALQNVRLTGIQCPSSDMILAVGSLDTTPPAPRVVLATLGQPWTLAFQTPLDQGDLFAVAPSKVGEIMAVGYKPGTSGTGAVVSVALKTTDPTAGVWQEDGRLARWPPLRGFSLGSNGEHVAVGDLGTLIYSSTDVADYVQETNPRGVVTMRSVWYAGRSFIAVGDEGTLLARGASGTWQVLPANLSAAVSWRGVHGTGPGDIYVVGGQTIAHYDGVEWREVTTTTGLPAERDLRAVYVDGGSSPARLHLAGDKLLMTCEIGAGSPPALTCGG